MNLSVLSSEYFYTWNTCIFTFWNSRLTFNPGLAQNVLWTTGPWCLPSDKIVNTSDIIGTSLDTYINPIKKFELQSIVKLYKKNIQLSE